MDFNTVTLFGKKTFADLLKEIYNNSTSKEKEIRNLIELLKPNIVTPGDAVIMVPLIKDYLDVSIKNDDILIKMAGIVQRALNNKGNEDSDYLSDKDKELLFQSIQQIDDQFRTNSPIIQHPSSVS